MEVVFASQNPGKLREVRAILGGTGLEAVSVPMWLGETETGTTYHENARLKATALLRLIRRPVLAEDSGLEVDALGGLPGARSARFAGSGATDEENNRKLLRLLEGVPVEQRTARYRAIALLLLPSGRELSAEGIFEGRIATGPRGGGGFGYDPIFLVEGEERTGAELSAEEKNARSHRAMALRRLVDQVRTESLLGK